MALERRIYDVSLTLDADTPTWPGNPPFRLESFKDMARGDSSNVSRLLLGTHAGTHVDAPRHFLPAGRGIDALDPHILLGPARVYQLGDIHHLDSATLEKLDMHNTTRLLLGTRNSQLLRQGSFTADFAYLDESACRYIVESGVKLVGVDYLSVEAWEAPGRPAHHILLGAGVIIIEGLYLGRVPAGEYDLLCLPLKIRHADGAPARVFLREL